MYEKRIGFPRRIAPHIGGNGLLSRRDLAPLHFVIRLRVACPRATAAIRCGEEAGRALDSLSRGKVSAQCESGAQRAEFHEFAREPLPVSALDHWPSPGVLSR